MQSRGSSPLKGFGLITFFVDFVELPHLIPSLYPSGQFSGLDDFLILSPLHVIFFFFGGHSLT